ncbi:alpha/beta hydrolase-fold protein [Cellulophaga tyrosinoxydans]|uniref:Putative esterase n=1 Tax=Cellulophaga tyrosinoxydans TaxID=504486 RepID=A0A1W2A604_9FLAO|nr:alpha/beta hydrolase-fold protein [Cellulophaga tyrosinoxydans]SMC55708.1 Putative esterase [Cellulophaga tyrosinoxydans]
MKITSFLMLIIISTITYGQEIDTLTFYSKAFQGERTVYIHKPEFYKYKSELVKIPVIYLLDGQNEWFVNPTISDIQYLRFTKEVPSAVIVVIPLKDRVKECAIVDLKTKLPLDKFITEELDKELKTYNLSDFKIIIGHSFSASFSLYSFYNHPDYYTSVIANSPFDEMQMLVEGFEQTDTIDKSKISIAIGSIHKDDVHRKKYDKLKNQFPSFYNSINTFEANYSAHNAVPIAAIPTLLTKVFQDYRSRYFEIAKVNMEYKLVKKPDSISEELNKIETASVIGNYYYPPEISDINGIASRYWNNELEDYATKIYELGLKYYPNYYDFYLSLYELTLNKDKTKSKEHLEKAEFLLKTVENNWKGKQEIIDEIKAEKIKNGW